MFCASLLSEPVPNYNQSESNTTFSEILIEIPNQENAFENVIYKTAAIMSRPQCV